MYYFKKNVIIILMLFVVFNAESQINKNLKSYVNLLDKELNKEHINSLKAKNNKYIHLLSLSYISRFIIESNVYNDVKKEFNDLGVLYESDIQYLIIKYYWCYLNEEEFFLNSELENMKRRNEYVIPLMCRDKTLEQYGDVVYKIQDYLKYLDNSIKSNKAIKSYNENGYELPFIELNKRMTKKIFYKDKKFICLKNNLVSLGIHDEEDVLQVVFEVYRGFILNEPIDFDKTISKYSD